MNLLKFSFFNDNTFLMSQTNVKKFVRKFSVQKVTRCLIIKIDDSTDDFKSQFFEQIETAFHDDDFLLNHIF